MVGRRGPSVGVVLVLLVLAAASRVVVMTLRAQRQALAAARREAERSAREDALTGLGNRRAFEESAGLEVAPALRNQAWLSVIADEIDGFSQIQDQFGRGQADVYVRAVAEILEQNARAGEECFRCDVNEFVMLLPNTDRTEAEVLDARLTTAIDAAGALQVGSQHVRVTFGVAEGGADETGAELLTAADAMRRAITASSQPSRR